MLELKLLKLHPLLEERSRASATSRPVREVKSRSARLNSRTSSSSPSATLMLMLLLTGRASLVGFPVRLMTLWRSALD